MTEQLLYGGQRLRELHGMYGAAVCVGPPVRKSEEKMKVPKLLVENSSAKPLAVAIEPWASLEVLAPDGKAFIEYSDPAEIEFSVSGDSSVVIGVITDHIKISANGGEKEFGDQSSSFDKLSG